MSSNEFFVDVPDAPDTGMQGSLSSGLPLGTPSLWQYLYEGSQKQFVDGFPFSIAYLISDFFGGATPLPGMKTSIILVDSVGGQTVPLSQIVSSAPPTNSQIVIATFPAMVKGSYLVCIEADLGGTVWAATPDRIEVL